MPLLIKFVNASGRQIAVNADLVRHAAPSNNPERVVLHFDDAHTVTVEGTLDSVVDKLRGL